MASSDSSYVAPNLATNDNVVHTSIEDPTSNSVGNQHNIHIIESMSTTGLISVSEQSVTYDKTSPSTATTSIHVDEHLQFIRSETKGIITFYRL